MDKSRRIRPKSTSPRSRRDFPERRPFFTEGARLLTTPEPVQIFLLAAHRRAPDRTRLSGDYVDYPDDATILFAGKVTGRLPSRTSIGILGAVTDQEFARIADADSPGLTKVRVAPRTASGVARVQQEFGTLGSTFSAQLATMHRNLKAGDPLADLLARNALTYGADTLLRFKGGEYELVWAALGTHVTGEAAAITAIQLAPEHYMQRPDQDYSPRLDPTRTSLSGFTQTLNFNRVSGRHWLFGVSSIYDTVAFEANQIGQMNGADGIQPGANITYRETQPGRIFRNYSIRLSQSNEWNHGWNRQTGSFQSTVNLMWVNFWTIIVVDQPDIFHGADMRLTRGGPLMGTPRGWNVNASFGNSATAQTRWTGGAGASENELGGTSRRVNGTFAFRPGPRWQLSVAPSYDRTTDAQQYVTTLNSGRPETFGSRYIFSYIERSTFAAELRMGFTLKPDVNLDVYAEPFAASGRYYDHGELLTPGSLQTNRPMAAAGTLLTVEPDGDRIVTAGTTTFTLANRDFNVRSFQSNVVLRWEWRPGSTLYVGLAAESRRARDHRRRASALPTRFARSRAPGSNIFLVKTSFWIPVS